MWTTFQVFIELVTILLLFYAFLFFWPQAMEDLSSQIRDQTRNPSIGREVLTTGLPGKFPNSFLEEKQISLRNLTTESICPLVSCNLLFCSIAMYIQVHKKHMFYSSSLKHTYTHTHTHTHMYTPIYSILLPRYPGSRRSPGNPLQYSCLGNPMNRGACWATVRGVAKSQTQVSTAHYLNCPVS